MKMATKAIELLFLLLFLASVVVFAFGGNGNFIDAADVAVMDSNVESSKFAANIDNLTINNKVSGNNNNNNNNDYNNSNDDIGIVDDIVNFTEFNQVTNKPAEIGVNAAVADAPAVVADAPASFDIGGNNEKFNCSQARTLKRGKRYLDFTKGSRVSWRTTMKNNILKVNTLWGYGWGFRSNFPFADKQDRLRPFFKRDLLHATIDMLDRHGLDGRACILKSYCTALLDSDTHIGGGMIFKLLKFIFSFNAHEKRHFPYLHLDNCHQLFHSHCPLSFNSISPYTDDV